MPTSAWVNLAPGEGEPTWAALAREYSACRQRFILHVQSWESYEPVQALQWSSVRYESHQQAIDERGVYAFVLDASNHAPNAFPPHSCILYVGETGNTGNGTLRSRLANYRNKRAQRDRPRVWKMLEQWSSSLIFYYAVVGQGMSTKEFETALLDALLPPVNNKDFSAEVSEARNVAFSD